MTELRYVSDYPWSAISYNEGIGTGPFEVWRPGGRGHMALVSIHNTKWQAKLSTLLPKFSGLQRFVFDTNKKELV